MSEPLRPATPLAGQALLTGPELRVTPGPAQQMVNLQGRDPGFADAVAAACGCRAPDTPGAVTTGNGVTLYWLSPNERLVVAPADHPEDLDNRLRQALTGECVAVTAVGAGHALLEITGTRSTALLARGCPLDLHPDTFPPGQCTRTRLGQATVLLHRLEWETDFRLFVRRSMADYLWQWLRAAQARLEKPEPAYGPIQAASGAGEDAAPSTSRSSRRRRSSLGERP